MKNTPLSFFSTDGSSLHPVYVDIVDRWLAHARAREDASKRADGAPSTSLCGGSATPLAGAGKGAKTSVASDARPRARGPDQRRPRIGASLRVRRARRGRS